MIWATPVVARPRLRRWPSPPIVPGIVEPTRRLVRLRCELIAAYHQAAVASATRAECELASISSTPEPSMSSSSTTSSTTTKRAATELWKFCGSSGGQWLQAASALAYRREQGDEPDWWTIGAPRRT